MIDLLTFPGWIALWAAIVLALAAFAAVAAGVIAAIERYARPELPITRRLRIYPRAYDPLVDTRPHRGVVVNGAMDPRD